MPMNLRNGSFFKLLNKLVVRALSDLKHSASTLCFISDKALLLVYPLARREAPTAGQRPAGKGGNIDRRLVPYTRDAMRIKCRIEFIYLYICINRGPHAHGI